MNKYKLTPAQQLVIDRMVEGERLIKEYPIDHTKSAVWILSGSNINKTTILCLLRKGLIAKGEDQGTIGRVHYYKLT